MKYYNYTLVSDNYIGLHAFPGSDLEKLNETNGYVVQHEWSEGTWQPSKEDQYVAHGTLRQDLKINGYRLPFSKVFSTFEQVRIFLNYHFMLYHNTKGKMLILNCKKIICSLGWLILGRNFLPLFEDTQLLLRNWIFKKH